jgi:hypothetical protein
MARFLISTIVKEGVHALSGLRGLAPFVVGAVVLVAIGLVAVDATAALVLDVDGIGGNGMTTWRFSGSSNANSGGTIRTSVGSANFSVADTFEPDFTGNFLSNNLIQNQLFLLSGSPTVTVGSDTQTITHIFLDEDGSSRDDFGIRTDVALPYAAGEASIWTGKFTVALDIDNFNPGSYRLNSAQSNGGGFLFAGVDDVILNFSIGPDPIEIALDIKPGPSNNTVPLNGNGTLQMAILANADFDVADVDIDSLLFGDSFLVDGGATPLGAVSDKLRDLNHDGLEDLLVGFSISDLVDGGALDSSSIEGRLTGELFDGTPIIGSDIVRMVPQNNGGGGNLSIATVPEPSTGLLLLVGWALVPRRQRLN